MKVFDKDGDEVSYGRVLSTGKQFMIVELPEYGDAHIVGLCSEDDDNWFLESIFSSMWLNDLHNVVACAETMSHVV